MAHRNLQEAKRTKNDEFYTRLEDIALELKNYRELFRGKVVFCNCDDPYESNFFKYFALNFNTLGLRKLIATCYDGSPITGNELPLIFELEENTTPKKVAYKVEITEVKDMNGDGAVDLSDVRILLQNDKNVMQPLRGNGDFRSVECIELLKQADIVVTNPPFSLFREYVAQLVKYDKQFIIMGNTNALTYKEIFLLFKQDQIRTGYTHFNTGMMFYVPDSFIQFHHIEQRQVGDTIVPTKVARVSTACWYTNLPVRRHQEFLILTERYDPERYPKYDNYDAINVNAFNDIPIDYEGVMGVPVTFLDKFNPEQFELIWTTDRGGDGMLEAYKKPHDRYDAPVVKGAGIYKRILIRRKQ